MSSQTFPRRVSALPAAVYETIAEHGSAALAVSDHPDGRRIAWVNRAALDLLGLTRDEVTGTVLAPSGLRELYGADHWRVVIDDALTAGTADSVWTDALTLDSAQSFAIQLNVQALEAGAAAVLIRPTSDLQRITEAKLSEAEHRFRALGEHAPIGIIVSEAGLRVGYVNSQFCQIVGQKPEDLTGMRWLTQVHVDDQPSLLAAIDRVLAGAPTSLVARLWSAHPIEQPDVATPRWAQIRLAPVVTPRRSAGFIATIEDITELRAREEQLAFLAGHDSLTGLANRRTLMESLALVLSSRRSREREVAVLFFDLDKFKPINDTLGHDAGDRVLIEVANRLSQSARDGDLVARFAGDEFVVLVRGVASVDEAEIAAARLVAAVGKPIAVGSQDVVVSASVGIAYPGEHDSAADVLRAADRNMYEAKRRSRPTIPVDRPLADIKLSAHAG